MRVNLAAASSAAAAALLAAVGHAQHPAQVVVSIAAAFSFLAVLPRRGPATRSEWLTVRLLLAGNLIVFGVSYEHHLLGADLRRRARGRAHPDQPAAARAQGRARADRGGPTAGPGHE